MAMKKNKRRKVWLAWALAYNGELRRVTESRGLMPVLPLVRKGWKRYKVRVIEEAEDTERRL